MSWDLKARRFVEHGTLDPRVVARVSQQSQQFGIILNVLGRTPDFVFLFFLFEFLIK